MWFFLDVFLMWDFDDLANAISLAVLSGAPSLVLDKKTWMKQQRVWETLSIIGLGHLGRSWEIHQILFVFFDGDKYVYIKVARTYCRYIIATCKGDIYKK